MPAGKANPWETARNWVRARLAYPQNHPQMVTVLNKTSLLSIKLIFQGLDFEAHEHGQDKEGRRVTKGHPAENVVLLGGKSKGEF